MWLREIVDVFGDLVSIEAKQLARNDEALGEFALILWRGRQSLLSIASVVPGNAGGLADLIGLTLALESTDSRYRARIEGLSAERT